MLKNNCMMSLVLRGEDIRMKGIDKKISVARLEGFSDGLIAIIITLMVLEIPLPSNMELPSIIEFSKAICIYFASFIVVGAQWNRHHLLMEKVEKVSNSFIWKNLIYLFLLSLLPLFMKWLIQYPNNVIPAISYSVVYLLTDMAFKLLFVSIFKDKIESVKINKKIVGKPTVVFKIVPIMIFILMLVLAYFFPEIAIMLFVVFPVVMSLANIFKS